MKNLDPRVKKSAKKILNLATRSKRSMQVNQLNFARTTKFINREALRISQPKIDKKKLKKLFKTDFAAIASDSIGGGGGGGLGLPGFDLPFGGGGGRGRRGGRRGGPPSRRAQQRYRRRFGNRAANRRFGRLPQFGRGRGIRVPRAGGLLGVAFAGLEYGGRLSDGQTQEQAITGTAASTAGGLAGGFAGAKGGAALGALIGSIVPGAGTAIGAAIGGLIGGVAGGMAGSSLAGGAADQLTGVKQEKIIGQEDKNKEDNKLEAVNNNTAFMQSLNKFDELLDRLARLRLAPEEELDANADGSGLDDDFKPFKSKTGIDIPPELTFKAKELQQKYEETGETQSALTPYGFLKVSPKAPNRLGFLGGPDMTPELSFNPKLTIDSNKQAVRDAELLFSIANAPATFGAVRGAVRGAKGRVTPRVVTPGSQRPIVRPARQINKKMAKPEVKSEPLVQGPAQNIFESQTPSRVRQTELRRPLTGKDAMRQTEIDTRIDMTKDFTSGRAGADAQRANTDRQNVNFAKDALTRKPSERGPLNKEVVKYEDGPVEFMRPGGDFVTSEEFMLKRLMREYPGMDINKLLDTSKPGLKEQLLKMKGFGDQSSADLKPGSQNIASAGINQYTVYEAPNNTLIVQPSGGGMPPPPQQPPQMIAQSPPLDMQMMGGGVSEMDIVKTLNTVQLFTDLTTT